MTSFGFWQDMAADTGQFFCMICFEVFPLVEAYEDKDGDKWDMCKPCGRMEEEHKANCSSTRHSHTDSRQGVGT